MTDTEDLEEHLKKFKADEESVIHTTIMLAGDRDSQKILSTWSMSRIAWKRPKSSPPSSIRELWDWLWSGSQIDWDALSSRTGMSAARLQKLFEPLRVNQLLYPDGTIPEHAMAFLRSEVRKELPKAGKK